MKKIVIIGGGIAGLSAGIFAQKNGFESVILEKHHTLGGECTGWNRQGYHIDGCIHWLVGTKEGTQMRQLWETVGALDGVEVYHPETFLSFEYEGVIVPLYRDLERLKASWLAISPPDEEAIEEFYQCIRQLQTFQIPAGKPMDLMSLSEKIKLLSSMKDAGIIMRKYGKVSLDAYAARYKHPAIQKLLTTFVPKDYSTSSIFFALATFTSDNASIPYGGSKAMATRMVERYLSLGGRIQTSCEAVSLEWDNKKVNRVTCKNGKHFTADYFIAACDAHVLYTRLLKDQYLDKAFSKRYHNIIDYPLASNIYLSFGYEGTLENQPRTLRFSITPFTINEEPIEYLTVNHYQYEPEFAPKGHVLLTCAINQYASDCNAWFALAQDAKAYQHEKERIGHEVIKAMEMKYPFMKGKIKLLDIATPITYEKYCNAYRGAFMAFLPTIQGKSMEHTGCIKGLDNLFLSGQWLQPPGGLPVAVITGKNTVMRICKKEKRTFINQ